MSAPSSSASSASSSSSSFPSINLLTSSSPSPLFNSLPSILPFLNSSSSSNLYQILSQLSFYDGLIYDHITDILSLSSSSLALISHSNDYHHEIKYLQHPTGSMTSASIIDRKLFSSDHHKTDQFLDLLLSTYKDTRRERIKYKITLILIQNRTETFEFFDMKSYWRFISAICHCRPQERGSSSSSSSYRGKCFITNSEFMKGTGGGGTGTGNGNGISQGGGNQNRRKDVEIFFQISNCQLEVRPMSSSSSTTLPAAQSQSLEPHTINLLTDLHALGLHSDYDLPYLYELQFSSYSCLLHDMNDGHLLEHLHLTVITELEDGTPLVEDIGDLSDDIFFSMLIPNNLSLVLKLVVKYDLQADDHSSTVSHQSRPSSLHHPHPLPPHSMTLGKINFPMHSFIPFHSTSPAPSPHRSTPTPSPSSPRRQRANSYSASSSNPFTLLSSSSFPITMPIEIPITPPDMDLIAKLSIYRLENLPSSSSASSSPPSQVLVPPSAYCVVYLVGCDGEIIESLGNKTLPIKSTNPCWNLEFLLHTPLGISEIESVLIKVKDASVGTFRHKHLGQVELPIDIFLPTHPPAQLRLPLMPTDRMRTSTAGGHHDSLGEILLGTQLVKIPKVNGTSSVLAPSASTSSTKQRTSLTSMFLHSLDPSPPSPPPAGLNQLPTPEIKNISQVVAPSTSTTHFLSHTQRLTLRSLSVDENDEHLHPEPAPGGGLVKFKTELKKMTPSAVWWSCLGLSSEMIHDGTSGGGRATEESSAAAASWWDEKECLFAVEEFVLRRRRIRATSHRERESESSTRHEEQEELLEDYMRVPWSQVFSFVLLSYLCSHCS
jgi:hypothetical protein